MSTIYLKIGTWTFPCLPKRGSLSSFEQQKCNPLKICVSYYVFFCIYYSVNCKYLIKNAKASAIRTVAQHHSNMMLTQNNPPSRQKWWFFLNLFLKTVLQILKLFNPEFWHLIQNTHLSSIVWDFHGGKDWSKPSLKKLCIECIIVFKQMNIFVLRSQKGTLLKCYIFADLVFVCLFVCSCLFLFLVGVFFGFFIELKCQT